MAFSVSPNNTTTQRGCADAETMDIVEMVLTGRVNKGLVSLIQMVGGQAVGLCGKDSNLLAARQMVEQDIGFVGEVTRVNKTLLQSLLDSSFIPVVSTVAVDSESGQALNVNADTAAGEIASALQVFSFFCHQCSTIYCDPGGVVLSDTQQIVLTNVE